MKEMDFGIRYKLVRRCDGVWGVSFRGYYLHGTAWHSSETEARRHFAEVTA